MKILKYMYYRMYKAYEAKNDSPVLRAFMYISLCYFAIIAVTILYFEKVLNLLGVISGRLIPQIDPLLQKILFITIISIYSYFVYCRKGIQYYEDLFEDKGWLNSHIKIWMLILFPFVVLFGGIFLLVPLFGGEIMGEKIIGLFCK